MELNIADVDIITKFMGYPYIRYNVKVRYVESDGDSYIVNYDWVASKTQISSDNDIMYSHWFDANTIYSTNSCYHDSLDHILGVVDKIQSMNYSSEINFMPGNGYRTMFYSDGCEIIKNKFFDKRIDSIYYAVIGFIKYYNKNY